MRRPRLPRRTWLVLAAALCAASWRAARGQASGLGLVRESAVKAAFLYKFGSFVEWPAGVFRAADAPFVIAVYGDDAVAAELEQVTAGREMSGHPVAVVRVREPDDTRGVHVLYAGGPRASRAREVLASARGPVLTVADSPLAGIDPVLYFTLEEGRVRFVASLRAAEARGLKLSSKLLAVAQGVEGR